jgi:hypothetical protein
MKSNSIRAIVPYRWNGLWVFDDKETGLVREAFVSGADLLCEQLCHGENSFTLLFSDIPFPGYQMHLTLKHRCGVGHTYQTLGQEAWLCPALLLYFKEAPANIYARSVPIVTPKRKTRTKFSKGSKTDRLEAYGWHSGGDY